MRKLAIVVALASTALATTAFARNDAWYIGIEGGPSIVEDASLRITGPGARTGTGTVDHRTGYDADGIIGYDFGGFRLESEVAYKKASINNYASTTTTPVSNAMGNTVNAPAGSYSAGGSSNVLSFMVNGLLDFGDDDGLSGFVGAGIGVARVKENLRLNTIGAGSLNDSDTGLAYQALAGVRAPLTDHWDVGLKYRFFNASKVDLIDRSGGAVHTRYRSHSLLGSLIYNFGEPAAPPPPPTPIADAPPPPPPPVIEAPVCTPGPYIVFFEWDKSDITAEAGSILDNAVSAYGNCGQAQVMLAGHADKSGTPKYNIGLSERRNTSVRSYLAGKGIPDGVISTQAFGEGAPRVETADGVRELQNRRVEITYGPGSGR
jgi:OmpA-OmpF porin, OOP family